MESSIPSTPRRGRNVRAETFATVSFTPSAARETISASKRSWSMGALS